jgi:hypothetical protein
MKLELYVPNSVVVTEGDVPQSLFIVASGTVVRENPVRDDGSSSSNVSLRSDISGSGSLRQLYAKRNVPLILFFLKEGNTFP